MNFFRSIAKRLLPSEKIGGLEITDDALKITYLSDRSGGAQWDSFSAKPLKAAVVDGKVQNIDALAQQIRELFASIITGRKLSRDFIVSIPESNVYVQSIKIPVAVDENEIAGVVAHNPAITLPFLLTSAYFSWQTIGIEGLERRILLTLVQRGVVDRYQKAVEMAGLHTIALQTPSLGFEFVFAFPKDISILFFLEKTSFSQAIYLNGKLVFKRTALYQDFLPAGAKLRPETIGDLIAKEFTKAKDYALSELGEHLAVSLFLVSYGEGVDQIIDYLKKKGLPADKPKVKPMMLPKTVPNFWPWVGVLGASFRGLVPRRSDIFASLLALSTKEQYLQRKKTIFFGRTIKIVLSAFLFYVVSFFSMGVFLSQMNQRVQEEWKKQQELTLPQELVVLEEEVQKFNAAVGRVRPIQDTVRSFIPVLRGVDEFVFPGISIGRVQMIRQLDNTVTISFGGNAQTRDTLLAFKKHLEAKENFKNVQTPLAELAQRQNINFTMSLSYVPS